MKKGYKFLKLLGEGSFGKAYLCQDIQDNSKCVIKQIILDDLNDDEIKDTLNEVDILKRLDHSNIIKFKSVFIKTKPNHILNIVMEYADGGDLNQKIKKQKDKKSPLTEKEIINYLTQICLALNHIHKKKIIHRDLKSGNIFLTKSGLVKLGDFGIAKGFKNTWEKAKTKVGTPYYLSPEIINSQPYDSKSDIWALGVLLYEMMTFKMPFNALSLASLSLKIIRGYYQPPPSSYSKDLIDLVKKCLNLDPKKRPSVENILKMPFIKKRIFGFLDEVQFNEDLSITIIKKFKEKKENEKIRRKKIIENKKLENDNVRQSQQKISNSNIEKDLTEKKEKNYESDKNKIKKFFEKRNSANNNNSNKPKIEIPKKKEINISQKYKIVTNDNNKIKDDKKPIEKKEPINFLKANKINIKNIKIVDKQAKNVNPSSGAHQEYQNMYKEDKTINEGLNDLISDYMDEEFDLNKINEDQYNQIRYLNNLSRFIKDEKQIGDEEESEISHSYNKINEESINNENESLNFDDININIENSNIVKENNKKEEINIEDKEIKELKKQIVKDIGNDIFKMVYNHVDNSTDKTEIKFNMELLAQKLTKEFENNKYDKKKLNIAIEKLPEIFAIVIQDRLIKFNS